MLLRILAGILAFVSLTAIAAEPPTDLRDAEAWYRAARLEAERIPDPEQRNLLGQLAAGSQKVTEDDAVKQVDALRAKYRGLPRVQAWQISREAARHFETLGYYRRAAEALDQAALEASSLDAEKKEESLREVESARYSLISQLAEQDAAFAEELADKFKNPLMRGEAFSSLAYHLAKSDMKEAERVLAKIGGERAKRALIGILLHSKQAPHVKRGVELLLQSAPMMSVVDLGRSFSSVEGIAQEIVATCDAQQLSKLTDLLEQTPRDSKQHFEAMNCLIAVRVAQGRIDDAVKLADTNGDSFRRQIRRKTISLALISAGRLAEAERVSDETGLELAAAYLRAKKPREALAAARRLDDIRLAYPHVIAALLLLPADDRDTAEQALHDLVYDDVRAHALAAWGVKVFQPREPERARALVVRAEKLLPQIKDTVQQRSAGLAVGQAYAQIGAEREADALLQKYGSPLHFLQVRLKVADERLKAKDQAGFERAMTQALLILQAKTPLSFGENSANEEFSPETWQRPRPRQPQLVNDVPNPYAGPPIPGRFAPPVPVAPAPVPPAPGARVAPEQLTHSEHDDAVVRFHFFLQASRLYRQAGDGKQARQLAASGIAAYSRVGGSFERWELYGESFLDAMTPQRLQEIAELAQDAKNPADRAVLLTLGGALAKHLREQMK
jgi:hypothetical protein